MHSQAYDAIHVDFDGRQVSVVSNVKGLVKAICDIFDHALVDHPIDVVREIRICETASGFLIKSGSVEAVVGDSLNDLPQLVKRQISEAFMQSRPDLLWMHAGVVAQNGKGLLLSGPSGQGKSTLSTMLVHNGWSLLSDDVAPLTSEALVLPYYEQPLRRIPADRSLAPTEVAALPRSPVPVSKFTVAREPVRAHLMVFLTYQHNGGCTSDRLSPGAAALEIARNTVNFGQVSQVALGKVTSLASSVPAFALCYGNSYDAANVLQALMPT